jgi:amino acid adenylation domain-containing protein/thioester reductase-like protein
MQQLTIWVLGHSALARVLVPELQAYGHLCCLHTDAASLPSLAADLIIDDGSLVLEPALRRDFGNAVLLSLGACLGMEDGAGLPLATLGVTWEGQTLIHCCAQADHAGNGQVLHQAAVQQWTDALCALVGQYSRDATVLSSFQPLAPLVGLAQHLLAFDALAYHHRLNQTARPDLLAIADQPLSLRLEASFAQYSHRVALRWNGHSCTYAALRNMAEPVRQYVIAQSTTGVPPVVGVCMSKSPRLFACVLGIVLAGAVYLPLEPSHPLERRRYILADSGARLLLHDADGDAPDGDWQTIDPATLAPCDAFHAPVRFGSDAPCMALYTSGTTGQPKGVLLSQRNLSHFTAWYVDYTDLNHQARVLQFSTLSFDSATIDLFPTWLTGASLIVANEDERRDPVQLAALLARERVTQGFFPPALLAILPLDQLASVGCIATGGDVCEPWVIETLAGQCRFLNLYGPTEATVLVTATELKPLSANRSLGGPIANSQSWLLDDQGWPVGNNETGELYILGPGVGLGYLNNEALTDERYVHLAMPDGTQTRAYRTGDLARWGQTGLELVGRKDNQVKIRGFRVEPEEIECCLRDARLCQQVAVVVDDSKRIIAFIARPLTAGINVVEELRAYLAARLPAYMQPALYVPLEQLPFAANGKVDRQALKSQSLPLPASTASEPKNERQKALQALWGELLDLRPAEISTDDSFFNLGGHSILLSRMLIALRERFNSVVSINRFIELPTIERLDHLLEADQTDTKGVIDPQILGDIARPLGITPLPLSALGDVHNILVTGANSFVGVHIVASLLEWGVTGVTCLVRPGNGKTAEERFAAALVDNKLAVDMSRVQVIAGDLSQKGFGLSEADYQQLDITCGSVIHNAANVNHVLDYAALSVDNIEPLFQLLAFCEGRRKKILNFVSTLSACSAVSASGTVLEAGPADTPPLYIRNGYNLSKWAGERILDRARQAGCFVNLFRPGNISFNSSNGVSQPYKNRLMLMLKGSLQLGAVPALELDFDLMPVDFLAKLIAFQASRHDPCAAVFNLHNPTPLRWSDYVGAFASAGHGFEVIPVHAWQQRLSEVDKDNALFGVLGFYLNGFEEDIGDISNIEYCNAAAVVQRMGETYPVKSQALLARGCTYLETIGFIQRNGTMTQLQPDTRIHNPTGPRVEASVEINAPASEVWAVVGDFGGFQQFITALETTQVIGTGPGQVRWKTFKDGNIAVEQLNSHDAVSMSMTWTLIHTTLPVGSLWAAMEVHALNAGRSRAVWTIQAEPLPGGSLSGDAFTQFLQGFAEGAMQEVGRVMSTAQA